MPDDTKSGGPGSEAGVDTRYNAAQARRIAEAEAAEAEAKRVREALERKEVAAAEDQVRGPSGD